MSLKNVTKILISIFIITFLTSCNEQITLNDDTLYIIDKHLILTLCDPISDDDIYMQLMRELKGSQEEIEACLEKLENYGDSVEIKNAIGVAYLLLREFDEAKLYFDEALEMAEIPEQKVCILNNMAEVECWLDSNEIAIEKLYLINEIGTNNSIRQLVIESNITVVEMFIHNNPVSDSLQIKALLKQEKKLLGSNQFIGIFNYNSLGMTCYYADKIKRGNEYIQKAIEINESLYQYKSVEANLYVILSNINAYYPKHRDQAMVFINQAMEIYTDIQYENGPDLLRCYLARGNIYLDENEISKALSDYQIVLGRCHPYHEIGATSFYNLANAYIRMPDLELAVKSYCCAYYMWDYQEVEEELRESIKYTLKNVYLQENYGKEDEFLSWFDMQILEAKEELDELWN